MRLGNAKMAAPIVRAAWTWMGMQFLSKNHILSTGKWLKRICSCGVIQRRTYYEHEYDSDMPEELEKFVLDWSKVKNTLGPSPLKEAPWPREEWVPEKSKRCGLLAIKLGMVPMWTKTGERLTATVLQAVENNVVKYIPPENSKFGKNSGVILVGAKNADPLKKSFEYSEQFREAMVPVKEWVMYYTVSPNAKIQPGTPLAAAHFRPGMFVDCRGRTIDKGFQGVMKRWGMKGQPASHGATKTHRKMGASGGGGSPGRIWPGKKMPGHMGNKMRWTVGLKVLRVNTKHNLLYIGGCLAGPKYGYIKVIDSVLPKNANPTTPPPFPTYYGDQDLDEDLYDEDVFRFSDASIEYEEEAEEAKR